MKRVNLADLPDLFALSSALDQALFLLANSPAEFRASDLCRAVDINPSMMTRMRLAHANPRYESVVCYRVLFHLLKYLLTCFPMLGILQNRKGQIVVRLYKTYKGKKLEEIMPVSLPPTPVAKRTAPKPGSTRWYLAQLN